MNQIFVKKKFLQEEFFKISVRKPYFMENRNMKIQI